MSEDDDGIDDGGVGVDDETVDRCEVVNVVPESLTIRLKRVPVPRDVNMPSGAANTGNDTADNNNVITADDADDAGTADDVNTADADAIDPSPDMLAMFLPLMPDDLDLVIRDDHAQHQYQPHQKDAFHAHHKVASKIPTDHTMAWQLNNAIRHALYIPDAKDVESISRVLPAKFTGIEKAARARKLTLFQYAYNRYPKWILKRLKRTVPSPRLLVIRLRLVLHAFRDVSDSRSGRKKSGKLLSEEAIHEFEKLISLASEGYLSDWPGVSLYEIRKIDDLGLTIYRCSRGSNCNETLHQPTTAGLDKYSHSPKTMIQYLRRFIHDWNQDRMVQHLMSPAFGHHCYSLIELIQVLSQRLGCGLYSNFKSRLSFRFIDEQREVRSGIMRLANSYALVQDDIDEDVVSSLSPTHQFLSSELGYRVAPTPIFGVRERHLYNVLQMNHNNGNQSKPKDSTFQLQATIWNREYVDVRNSVYPKLPLHLASHWQPYSKMLAVTKSLATYGVRFANTESQLDAMDLQYQQFMDDEELRADAASFGTAATTYEHMVTGLPTLVYEIDQIDNGDGPTGETSAADDCDSSSTSATKLVPSSMSLHRLSDQHMQKQPHPAIGKHFNYNGLDVLPATSSRAAPRCLHCSRTSPHCDGGTNNTAKLECGKKKKLLAKAARRSDAAKRRYHARYPKFKQSRGKRAVSASSSSTARILSTFPVSSLKQKSKNKKYTSHKKKSRTTIKNETTITTTHDGLDDLSLAAATLPKAKDELKPSPSKDDPKPPPSNVYYSQYKDIEVRSLNVDQQKGGNVCGVFSMLILLAVESLFRSCQTLSRSQIWHCIARLSLCRNGLKQPAMYQHVADMMKADELSVFPSNQLRRYGGNAVNRAFKIRVFKTPWLARRQSSAINIDPVLKPVLSHLMSAEAPQSGPGQSSRHQRQEILRQRRETNELVLQTCFNVMPQRFEKIIRDAAEWSPGAIDKVEFNNLLTNAKALYPARAHQQPQDLVHYHYLQLQWQTLSKAWDTEYESSGGTDIRCHLLTVLRLPSSSIMADIFEQIRLKLSRSSTTYIRDTQHEKYIKSLKGVTNLKKEFCLTDNYMMWFNHRFKRMAAKVGGMVDGLIVSKLDHILHYFNRRSNASHDDDQIVSQIMFIEPRSHFVPHIILPPGFPSVKYVNPVVVLMDSLVQSTTFPIAEIQIHMIVNQLLRPENVQWSKKLVQVPQNDNDKYYQLLASSTEVDD